MLKATSSIVNVSQITGVLPVVNGGTGVTTSTGTGSTVLSAAPTLSGNVTLSTGNLIVASGQGIDFSATPGTGTSELLNDYEEGTWAPTLVSQTGSFGAITYNALNGGRYVKVGSVVHVQCFVFTDSVALGTASDEVRITGLPFTSAASTGSTQDGFSSLAVSQTASWVVNQPNAAMVRANSTQVTLFYKTLSNGGSLAMDVSEVTTATTGNAIRFAGTYISA